LDQADLRLMRRKYPKLFHSERACREETARLNKGADELLGPVVTLLHTPSKCMCHDFSKLKVDELREKLVECGLDSAGLKAELLE
jgi:hypothetical protein